MKITFRDHHCSLQTYIFINYQMSAILNLYVWTYKLFIKVYTQVTRELVSQMIPRSISKLRSANQTYVLRMLCFATIQPDFLHNIKSRSNSGKTCVLNSQQRKQRVLLQGLQEGSGQRESIRLRAQLHGRDRRAAIAQCSWNKCKYLVRYDREVSLYVFVDSEVLWTSWAQH